MTDLTTDDLDAIEQRANAATKGPWEHEGVGEIIQHFSLPEPATIVSTDVACMGYCYGGSAAGVERDEDADFIAHARDDVPALVAEVRRLRAMEQRVRALHRSVGIYDECDCPDDAKTEGHLDIYEIGMTCNKVYDICGECCRDGEYQTEDCAGCHEHQLGETYHCPTIRALDGGDHD